MPFDTTPTTKNSTLAKEDSIPQEQKELNQWMRGIYITQRNGLMFSMRCTNSVEFRHVRALLAKWTKEADININFDTVLSQ